MSQIDDPLKVVNRRILRICDTKKLFNKNNIPLNRENLDKFISFYDLEALNTKIYPVNFSYLGKNDSIRSI